MEHGQTSQINSSIASRSHQSNERIFVQNLNLSSIKSNSDQIRNMRLIAVNPSRRVESVIIIRSSNYSVKFKNKPYRKSVANSRILARVRSCLLVACQRSKSRNDPGTRKRRVRKNTPTFSKESKK